MGGGPRYSITAEVFAYPSILQPPSATFVCGVAGWEAQGGLRHHQGEDEGGSQEEIYPGGGGDNVGRHHSDPAKLTNIILPAER